MEVAAMRIDGKNGRKANETMDISREFEWILCQTQIFPFVAPIKRRRKEA
jgi:hypothetical protein